MLDRKQMNIAPFIGKKKKMKQTKDEITEAQRRIVEFRYDLLIPNFLHAMAEIGHLGAEKYGDGNFKLSRLEGNKGPINHIYDHLKQYQNGERHGYFGDVEHQLAAIAFNAMMEYYYITSGSYAKG